MCTRITIISALLFHLFTLTAQETITETLMHDGISRSYTVYVPADYNANTPVPLLLKFHGYSMSAEDMFFVGDMRPIADTAGFILVYPQGSIDDSGGTHWNVAGPNSKSDADDLGFTEAMLDALIAKYNIDTKRVYACGYSNGGFFSFDLACKMSDRIAAIGSVAGTMLLDSYNDCNATHPTAVISIHGTNDFTVSYNGLPGWMYSMDQVNDFWKNFNNTTSTPTVTPLPDLNNADGSTVEFSSWNDGDNCTSVVHYKVISGGHTWPDATGDPSKINVDVSASQLIWDFVSKHDLTGLINCNATSTDGVPQETTVQVFPNPTSGVLNIKNIAQNADLKFTDIAGRLLLSQKIDGDAVLDFNNLKLPKGMYFLTVSEEAGKAIFKVILE